MKIGKWGEMSRGETSFGEKRRTCANFGKKWGEMIFGEKRRREKCRGEKRHLGRNVFPPCLEYLFEEIDFVYSSIRMTFVFCSS